MKKEFITLLALISALSATASSNRITSYSTESRVQVTLATLIGAGSAGTFISLLCDNFESTGSKIFIGCVTALGGYAGWYWSSSRTPEERFNAAAKLLDQEITQHIIHALFNASNSDEVYYQADRAFDFHAYPRAKFMECLMRLFGDLTETQRTLKEAIATEVDRQSPNNMLITQGRIYLQKMDQYVAVIREWLPQLKNDHTYLLQNATYEAQLAREAAQRAETEATFARMDADMARWEAQADRQRANREIHQIRTQHQK